MFFPNTDFGPNLFLEGVQVFLGGLHFALQMLQTVHYQLPHWVHCYSATLLTPLSPDSDYTVGSGWWLDLLTSITITYKLLQYFTSIRSHFVIMDLLLVTTVCAFSLQTFQLACRLPHYA